MSPGQNYFQETIMISNVRIFWDEDSFLAGTLKSFNGLS
jgi:hypothetical protein